MDKMEKLYKYDIIVEKVGVEEVLAQLAEESSELSQAALKLRRKLTDKNPTPTRIEICSDNFTEEIADVILCLNILGWLTTYKRAKIEEIKEYKLDRWLERLKEVEENGD
nr:MAG TPA: nucleoside triphosphate pyrophosphohydrolase [Caudoviricetes sp.]